MLAHASGSSLIAHNSIVLLTTDTVAQTGSPSTPGHQHGASVTDGNGVTTQPGGIDGAINPELITDLVAYRLFMNAVAEPANASTSQIARERGKLFRARLGTQDLQAIAGIFAGYQAQRQTLAQSVQTVAPSASAEQAYEAQRDAITTATMAALKAALTPDGMSRLDNLIQQAKRQMSVSPLPQMPY